MSSPGKTILVFGIYVVSMGAWLIFWPNGLLTLFGFPATQEVWIRVVGAVALPLGYYYVQAARHELVPFFQATVRGRVVLCLVFGYFVAKGYARPTLLLFGAIDVCGAIWTFATLARQGPWGGGAVGG